MRIRVGFLVVHLQKFPGHAVQLANHLVVGHDQITLCAHETKFGIFSNNATASTWAVCGN